MKSKPTRESTQHVPVQGKSRAELDIGYEAYLSGLEEDYRVITQRQYLTEPKREIGYHVHMAKPRKT